MPKEIKAIIFDAARVLMNFDTNIFVQVISPYSLYTEEEILLKIKGSKELEEFDKGQISAQGFYKNLSDILQLKDLSFKEFEAEWKKILYWSNEDLGRIILSEIKPDIELFVLANMDELSWEIFTNFPVIKKYFPDKNQRLASCEVGYAKPDEVMYNEVAKRLGVPFGQCLFIDDNRENLEQVKKMGGDTIYYDCRTHSLDYLNDEMNKRNVFRE